MKKIEYSHVVRKKLQALKAYLLDEFDAAFSQKSIKQITTSVRNLSKFPEKGVAVSTMYDIDCDYRYIYVSHNYLFYRIEEDKIIVVEMFDERENFMYKLFGISTTSQKSVDYWGDDYE